MSRLKVGHIVVIFFLLIVSALVQANDLTIVCDGCNDVAKKDRAHSLAMQSMTNQEKNSFSPNTKIVNVIDLKSDSIVSFSVTTSRMPSSPVFYWTVWSQNSVLISPSSVIKSKFDNLIMRKQELTLSISSIVIPTTVIEDPWEFVGCSYCESVVQDYIRSQTAAQIESFVLSMEALALSVGVLNTSLPNTYELSLESGGKVIIETSIGVGQPPPVLIKVTKIVDAAFNEVPTDPQKLINTAIYLIDSDSAVIINHYINPFSYGVTVGIGRVTIDDCVWDEYYEFCDFD